MLRTNTRIGLAAATALGLALLLFAAGGILLGGHPDTATARSGAAGGDLRGIVALQAQLKREPRDWRSWAALGLTYVDAARTAQDPSLYPKADQALRRSLQLRPGSDNDRALGGLAALAAARHDFSGARTWAQRALAVNGYSATALAVLADAETELGNYPAGLAAAHRLDANQPGIASFTRLSYQAELRGQAAEAERLLELAVTAAVTPADVAFVRYHLGELYRQQGRAAEAAREYALGLQARPGDPACTAGQARVAVAGGRTDEAVRLYRSIVAKVPAPAYVAELGDLLTSLHRPAEADQQYAVVRAQDRIARAGGVDVDLELALFDADHGAAASALSAARATWQRRHSVQAADALAWALHVSGRDAEAIGYADAALRLGTRSAGFHYHRGVIALALGRKAAARTDLVAALSIDPDFSVLQSANARHLLKGLS